MLQYGITITESSVSIPHNPLHPGTIILQIHPLHSSNSILQTCPNRLQSLILITSFFLKSVYIKKTTPFPAKRIHILSYAVAGLGVRDLFVRYLSVW